MVAIGLRSVDVDTRTGTSPCWAPIPRPRGGGLGLRS